jgi:hypothetical protein
MQGVFEDHTYKFLSVKIMSLADSVEAVESGEANLWVEDYALPQLKKADNQWRTFHVCTV